ncbi:DUF2625 family protein [Nocardia terrae]|uniref:DUF2625 family protein n=1 Tax=Nocardia terrae TaxID=2675851 RepID=UPI0012F8A678|nr:DUF2625 family protein [Nocardia terrae]
MTVRNIDELIDTDDPAWPELAGKISDSAIPVEVLPATPARARDALYRLQVTARSVLGGLVLNTGGLVVDHGWLRILGGGHGDLPDVATMNRMADPEPGRESPGALVVAVDVLGGMFAINGGALPGNPGGICYFGPDTLAWQPLGGGHSSFVDWVLRGGLEDFYADLRWDGWAAETENLPPDQGLAIYPPLWSAEGRGDIAATSRRGCPLPELTAQHLDTAGQMAEPPR